MEKIFSLLSGSTDETRQWGRRLGVNISCPFLVGLVGDLGSGKTVLVQGIAQGMRINTPVKSPSFTIVQEYSGRHPLFHFDLYRIQSEEEMFYLGYQEYFYQEKAGVVIEWADKIPHLLPSEYLKVQLRFINFDQREITFVPYGQRYERLVRIIRERKNCCC